MNIRILLSIYFIQFSMSINLYFKYPLQRFIYDEQTDTIILASINNLYSINAKNFTILSHLDLTPKLNEENLLRKSQKFLEKNFYYFSTTSYLNSTLNQTYNQLLVFVNQSILICSTSNCHSSCQLRSLNNLSLIKTTSQRIVSSSLSSPIGLIDKNNEIIYLANTYDSICDPFYEIPTITARKLSLDDFLSIINLNSGQSALQQSTYTLRLLNTRLIKDFFLHYIYTFQYKYFNYFLTIQQSDIHHLHKSKLQTRIIRFCQTLKQTIIKSYVEIPLTCGKNYHYLISAKYIDEKKILYGLFRNTTLANQTSTSHALCSYSIDDIQKEFLQTIKHCIIDGKGYRGLGFLSPDTHCVSSKMEILDDDYCPNENDHFFQYPIGGHRSIEQIEPIIELKDNVNFTSLEIGFNENNILFLIGDDNGTVHMIDNSNRNEIYKRNYQSKIIVDLKIIKQNEFLILTDNQIIKQNLTTCEQYQTCDQCANVSICHWCSKEHRCTDKFQCTDEIMTDNRIHMCKIIEHVTPKIISFDKLNTELQIFFNIPIEIDEYMCQFKFDSKREIFRTSAIVHKNYVKCFTPLLNNMNQMISNVTLTLLKQGLINMTYGHYNLLFINCSKLFSCSSCTYYSNVCQWNRYTTSCISQYDENLYTINHRSLIKNFHQCPKIYLQKTNSHRLTYRKNKTFLIHIENCNQTININSCQLNNREKTIDLLDFNPILIRKRYLYNDLCLIKCKFELFDKNYFNQTVLYRPLKLDLSIEYENKMISIIPHTQISFYDCEQMALNCSSCLQLDSNYNCVWCNNMCRLKTDVNHCLNNRECLSAIINKIEPVNLPMNGGTIVRIDGKNFQLFNLSIDVDDIPCQLIEDQSSTETIFCRTGNAGAISRTGHLRLKSGPNEPHIYSHEIISYVYPKIESISPIVGIASGGTILTIQGQHFTIGNNNVNIFIGNNRCQLLSITEKEIQCETKPFSSINLNENQPIKIIFDRQTKLIYDEFFTIQPDPILYSFDKFHQYKSFTSGGHQIIIQGQNFHYAQNIQLGFKYLVSLTPLVRNNTHLIFSTPSIQQLNLNHQRLIDITIYLDNFNRSSTLIYVNDPVIYQLEPLLRTFTNELIIHGINLTAIGHRKTDVLVHIGCDLCRIVYFDREKIICRPPTYRPEKYSKDKRLCYRTEHPTIIVTIDNIQSHIGFMIYPKRLAIFGLISGCLFSIFIIIISIFIVICLKIRLKQRKYFEQYLNTNKNFLNRNIKTKNEIYSFMNSCSIKFKVRSYINYLQIFYLNNHLYSQQQNININENLIESFKILIETNENFRQFLFEYVIQTNNYQLLNYLILTQRYHFRNLFKYKKYPFISMNIFILTFYDLFLINPIHSLFSQLYYQLKMKIFNGPIDFIEQNLSYYSLNLDTILNEYSIKYNTIKIHVHIENTNFDDLVLNLTCLTCDTITQVKQKIIFHLNLSNILKIDECQLYLLNNNLSSSSSSTASSSVPLTRKSMLTHIIFNSDMKYSTKVLNDFEHDSNSLLLNDIDNTNERINNWIKLNTLQHYGIVNDGYEFKMVLLNQNLNSLMANDDFKTTLLSSGHYCSTTSFNDNIIFNYLPSSHYNRNEIPVYDRTRYIHLINHTYEEIDFQYNKISLNKYSNETSRLFETKSTINTILINLIENLFTKLFHSNTYLNELIEQNTYLYHLFFCHFIPFIFQNYNCLFDIAIDKYLISSFDMLALIFQIGCCQQNQYDCLLCIDLCHKDNYDLNVQKCTFIFSDEIQRVRLYYSNIENYLINKTDQSEYSTTNTGIDRIFELDKSIYSNLIEYCYLHSDEIIRYLKIHETNNTTDLSTFINFIDTYKNT